MRWEEKLFGVDAMLKMYPTSEQWNRSYRAEPKTAVSSRCTRITGSQRREMMRGEVFGRTECSADCKSVRR